MPTKQHRIDVAGPDSSNTFSHWMEIEMRIWSHHIIDKAKIYDVNVVEKKRKYVKRVKWINELRQSDVYYSDTECLMLLQLALLLKCTFHEINPLHSHNPHITNTYMNGPNEWMFDVITYHCPIYGWWMIEKKRERGEKRGHSDYELLSCHLVKRNMANPTNYECMRNHENGTVIDYPLDEYQKYLHILYSNTTTTTNPTTIMISIKNTKSISKLVIHKT